MPTTSFLHHVEFIVKSLENSMPYFTGILGLRPVAKCKKTSPSNASIEQLLFSYNRVFILLTEINIDHKDVNKIHFSDFSCYTQGNKTKLDSIQGFGHNVVFNVGKSIHKIVDSFKRSFPEALIKDAYMVSDSNGKVEVAIIKSPISDLIHTLIDTSLYNGLFLPNFHSFGTYDFEVAQNSNDLFYFIDHITFACEKNSFKEYHKFYQDFLDFSRFKINKSESVEDGLVISDVDINIRLTALNYYKCSELVLKSRYSTPLLLTFAESFSSGKDQITDFLKTNQGSGLQHIALYTPNILETCEVLFSRGMRFLHPPSIYYKEVKFEEIRRCGHDASKMEELGILIDFDKDVNDNIDINTRFVSYSVKDHNCGEIDSKYVGKNITLYGWLHSKRMDKFIILRDYTGLIQVYMGKEFKCLFGSLKQEAILKVSGTVAVRPSGQVNPNIKTGQIEIQALGVQVLNDVNDRYGNFDFYPNTPNSIPRALKHKHQFVWMRDFSFQRILRKRSFLLHQMCIFLQKHNFVNVETPTLFSSTPGGAKEFLVPTRDRGLFYSLPQSPQQLKQILMSGGIDRYYQVARCYRNEECEHDRQPEFTQLDIELSFTSEDHIKSLINDLLTFALNNECNSITFQEMSYQDAVDNYGTDKPDIRFGLKLTTLSPSLILNYPENSNVIAIKLPSGFNLSDQFYSHLETNIINDREDFFYYDTHLPTPFHIRKNSCKNSFSSSDINVGNLSKQLLKDESVIMCISHCKKKAQNSMAKIRLALGKHFNLISQNEMSNFSFLWVTNFPLFTFDVSNDRVESNHHPFTSPKDDQFDLLLSDPLKCTAQHYDLVLNGVEIGGGSIRIHNSEVQRYVLEDILRFSAKPLEHLLKALSQGCPPHGGIALGLDRLFSVLFNVELKDCLAFPKSPSGKDLLCNAPSVIKDDEILSSYHIKLA